MTIASWFTHGSYVVLVKDNQYIVHNSETGVDEHATPVFYEAIRFCKAFDQAVKQAISGQPETSSAASWGIEEESEHTIQ